MTAGMDNRFLRCYEEKRFRCLVETPKQCERQSEDRFRCLVETPKQCERQSEQSEDRFRCLIDTTTPTSNYSTRSNIAVESQSTLTTSIEIPKATTVYYSTKTPGTPSTPTSRVSFDERFDQLRRDRLPSSPLLSSRRRQNSTLSIASEESFPSLPSGPKSTPTTPVLTAWSSVVLKNVEEGGILHKKKPRVYSEQQDWEGEEEEIQFDEDGFPRMR
jgi:hypothetical protein